MRAADPLPPHDLDAERKVIGGILRDPDTLAAAVEVAPPEHYYYDAHQRILRAIQAIAGRGEPVELVGLRRELMQRRELQDVGGHEYLAELWTAVPTGALVEHYAGLVREEHTRRGLIHTARVIERDALARVAPAAELLATAQRRLAGVAGETTCERGSRSGALPLIYYRDVAPSLDAADFVEGLLIRGGMSVVYGDSNTGKTFFALDLALHVAGGMPWRGRDVEAGGVLYLALEGGHGIRNRVTAFQRDRQCGEAEFGFAVVPVAVDLCSPAADTGRVIEATRAAAAKIGGPVSLVVVDTLSRAMAGGNENSPDDMGALVGNVDRIRQTSGAHVMLVHHSGKDGARGARGHSLLRAATDTEIEVSRDHATGTSVARVTKQRDMEIGDEFAFALAKVELGANRRGKPVTSCVVREAEPPARDAKLSGDEQAALNVLADLIADKGRVGMPGAPEAISSIPEQWWRENYYDRCKPGVSQATRQKSYRRAMDGLIAAGRVAAGGERVWIAPDKPGQSRTCPAVSGRTKPDRGL
jgi:hypothetical protein